MNFKDIKELIEKIDNSSFSEIEINFEDGYLYLNKNTIRRKSEDQKPIEKTMLNVKQKNNESETTSTSEENFSDTENTIFYVRSPLVGIVYLQSGPEAKNYKAVGDKVTKGEVVCVIESMKVMNEIRSSVDGEITNIFVKNEELIEYDQEIFEILTSK